ncbi:MAG: hypothetical protein Q8K71_01985 [Polaromonas sp.]|nr:hypothetical protein [Polaromonas sp.]MDP3752646.1 hypothetical protein [Polaromonas sp.]
MPIQSFLDSQPKWLGNLLVASVLIGFVAFIVVTFAGMVVSTLPEVRGLTEADVAQAKLKIEIRRLQAQEIHVLQQENERAEISIQMERNKLVAQRKELGLPPENLTDKDRGGGLKSLTELLGLISANINLVVTVAALVMVFQTFSGRSDLWRSVLLFALLVAAGGFVTLLRGITTDVSASLTFREIVASVNTASVGLYMVLFGSMLSAYVLWLKRPSHRGSTAQGTTVTHSLAVDPVRSALWTLRDMAAQRRSPPR